MNPRYSRAAAAALLGAVAVLAAGCGDRTKIVPVSGRVLIDGKPLEHGFVQVTPEGYRAASGPIGPDGRFSLTTFEPNDGCAVGTHPAAVIATQTLGPTAQKWHAPKEYISAETSGLKVTIDGPTNDLTIELSWNGGQPFIERFNAE